MAEYKMHRITTLKLPQQEDAQKQERLEQLGLRFPTPIQSAALRAPADAVLRAPTGSGKTVAFLCVLLARCEACLRFIHEHVFDKRLSLCASLGIILLISGLNDLRCLNDVGKRSSVMVHGWLANIPVSG